MGKLIKILAPIIMIAIVGISVVVVLFQGNPTYEIDSTDFNSVVAYYDDVDLSGIKIIEKEKEKVVKEIPVDSSMVKSVDTTTSVGNNKNLVIEYAKNEFNLSFSVKYEVEFIVEEKTISTQYVLKSDEIQFPSTPEKAGYEFIAWSGFDGQTLNDNVDFVATFTDVPLNRPNLGNLSAEYGDTLAKFILPSNEQGKWEFVDDLSTVVGEIGQNRFMVQFIPTNSELSIVKDEITINVSKKKLEFKNLVTVFQYDSRSHRPTFELDVELSEDSIIYTGDDGIEVGSYFYSFKIVDEHYEGSRMGTFRIEESYITINVDSPEPITFGDELPEITYTVTGIDDPSILELKVVYPTVNRAGNYDLLVEVSEEASENFTIVINKGILIVNKANLEVSDPEFRTDPVYLNTLSSVEIVNDNPNGYWEWVNQDLVLRTTGLNSFDIKFIPNSSNFNEITKTVELTVLKKTIEIKIINNTYTYANTPYKVEYDFLGLEDNYTPQVDGEITEIDAGNYPVTLKINDNYYTGIVGTTLIINKATPDKGFNLDLDPVYVESKLRDIALPPCYSWITGSTDLLTAGLNLEYDAKYTPDDTDNYEILYGKIKIDVLKKESQIYGVEDSYSFEFDNTEKTLSGITTNPSNAELVYTYTLNGAIANRLYNAGTYNVTIEILENDFYLASKVSTTVIITQIKDSRPADTVYAIYGDTLGMFSLPESSYGVWSWSEGDDTVVGDTGEVYHRAVFKSSDINYINDYINVKFIIEKKSVEFINIESTFTYDTYEHQASYSFDVDLDLNVIIKNADNEADTGVRVNAGTYQFNYIIDDNNYTGSTAITLTINKAIPVTAEDFANINPQVSYNTTLGEIELPEGYSFDLPSTTVVSVIGENEYKALYIPIDKGNYETVEGVIIVTAIKAAASLEVTNSTEGIVEYTYGDKYNIETSINHNESELSFEYYLNDEKVESITNVGTYKVIVTLVESEHYLEAVKEIELVVSPKTVNVTWTNSESYTYNPDGQTEITAYYNDINGTKIYLTLVEKDNKAFMNADSYSFSVNSGDPNYILSEDTNALEVEILKATFDMTNVEWNYNENTNYIYNGSTYEVKLNNLPEGLTAIYYNNSYIDAGDYNATVEFEYSNNYNDVEAIEGITWSIAQANVTVSWNKEEAYVYNGKEFAYPTATINSVLRAVISLDVTLTNADSFKNAGTYKFETVDESGNYNLSNNELEITIVPMDIEFTWEENSYTYTGNILSNPKATFKDAAGKDVTVTATCEEEFKNAGDYEFKLVYSDSNYNILEASLVKNYTVEKATYDMNNITWSYIDPYTYNGSEYEITISGLPTGVELSEYNSNKATNKGSYTAEAVLEYDTINYYPIDNPTITWEINALEVKVEWDTEESYVYGTNFNIPSASYKDINNNDISLAVVEVNNKTFEAVGSYTFIASFVSSDNELGNYTLSSNQINVSITQASVDDVTSINATYGDTLEAASASLPTSAYGTWSFAYDDLDSIYVGSVGENEFNVKFTATNPNYESFDSTIIVKVQKVMLTIIVNDNTYTYDGTEKTIKYNVEGFVNDETLESAGVIVSGNITGINVADSKSTTLNLSADNYYADSVNTSLTINRASATITSTLTDYAEDYTGSEFVIDSNYFSVSSGASCSIYVSQNGEEAKIVNAGTYNVKVSAPQTDNYLAPADLTFEFTVNKVLPKLEYIGKYEYTYGATIDAEVVTNADNTGNITYTYYKPNEDTEEYEEVSEIKEAGTYKLIAKVEESTNYKENSLEVTGIIVNKAELDLNELTQIEAIYGQYLSEFSFTQPDNGTWSWNVEDPSQVLVGDVGSEVTHQAMFTPNDLDNYEIEYQDVKFVISATTLTINIINSTYTYNEEAQSVSYEVIGFKADDTIIDVTVTVSSGQITATNVGSYSFTLTITGNSNYTGSKNGTLVIKFADPTYVIPTFEATYGDTYGSINAIANTGTVGNWKINGNSDSLVGDVGDYTVTATFTPNDTNYNSKTVETTLKVNAATYIPTALPTNLTATYGDLLSSVKLTSSDTTGSWSWEDSSDLVGDAGENKHYAIYTINDNYVPYEVELTINVSKADSIITNNVSGNLVYNATNQIDGLFELNHSEKKLQYVINKDGVEAEFINAGTYKIVVSVEESNNYNAASLTVEELIIEKATPETIFDELSYEAYWNTTLADLSVKLPQGYSFTYPNTVLETVDEENAQKFAAIYTPSDTDNYNTVKGDISVTVKKVIGEIYAEDSYEFTYDVDNEKGFTIDATTNNTDTDAEIKYLVNNVDINENPIINAGTYTVVITAQATAHYTSATKTVTVVVNQAYADIIVDDTVSYGATISDVSATTSTYGSIVITDTNPNEAVSLAAVEDFLGNAGQTVTLYLVFTPYEEYATNFAAFVKELTVTIVKKELTFTNVVSTYTYDGTEKTITYTLDGFVDSKTTSDITVDGNFSATTVAQSVTSVTLEINDSNYYGTLETSLVINKADPVTEDDFASIVREVDWNKTLADIEALPEGYTFDLPSTTSVGEVGTNTFKATYTPSDTENYNTVSGDISVTVNRLNTKLTVSSYNNLTYISGKTYEITASVNHNEDTTIAITILYGGVEVENLSNAGTYEITVTATQTSHYKAAEVTTSLTIAQATPTTDFTDVFTVKWSEDLTLADITTLDSGYAWDDSTTALADIKTDKYLAIYTPSDEVNYKSVEGYFTVTVNRADASITSDAAYTLVYNGSAQTLTNVKPSHSETSVVYTVDNEEAQLINAGTYNVVIVLPESTHYNKATCNATVTINKASVTFDESYTATYGDTLGSLGSLPKSDYGTWTWKNGNDTLVGDAGTQTHQVVFTPSEEYADNYAAVTANAKVTVKQFVSNITVSIPDDLVYDGTTYNPNNWFTLNHSYGTLLISVKLNNVTSNICNAGTYTIVASLAESANVAGVNETYTLTINQATYTPTSKPTAATATYGDTLNTVALNGGDSAGTWEWVSGTDLVGGAGTRTHTAKFTPSDTNYAVSTHQITVTVVKKTLTIEATTTTYTYSGSAQSITYSASGLVSGDSTPTINGNTAYTNAGSYPISLDVSSDNYEGSLSTTLVINKATPTLSIPSQSTYEDRVVDLDLVSTASATNPVSSIGVAGEFTYDETKVVYPDNATSKTHTITIEVTFTPTDTDNYKINADGVLSVTLTAVATNDTYYYGTVEKALTGTSSGTVTVIVGTDPVIRNNCTVLADVTLFIPYDDELSVKGSDDAEADYYVTTSGSFDNPNTSTDTSNLGTTDAGYFTNESRLKNTLTISEGIILTNKGIIEISGQLSGGVGGSYAAGQTYGYYTRILLEDDAEIYSEGTINCYGYIDEEELDNGSIVTINSGALYMPFVLRDFRGGSYMYAVYKERQSMMSTPFNQYELRNVNSLILIKYNGQLNCWANLYAGSQQNYTNVNYIGNTSNHFIMMNNETYSYVEYKYNVNTEVANMKLYGGAQFNSIKLEVNVLGTVEMDTTDYYFPISWRHNISLCKNNNQANNAIFSMPQTYKILPGGQLTVESGTELSIGELSIYESWTDTISGSGLTPYGSGKSLSRGKFIVNGKVTATALAGIVETKSSGAELIVSGKNSITTYESTGALSGSSILASIEFETVINYLKLYLYKNGSVDTKASFASAGTYLSKDGGWYAEKATIYYDANGGTLTGDLLEGPYSVGDGYVISSVSTTDPTRDYYTFSGWYLDSSCTQEAIGQTIFTSVTLYAKWTPITYSINFEDDYYDDFTNTVNTYDTFTFNVTSSSQLPTDVTNGPTDAPYVFGGWYLDANHTLRIYNTSEIDLSVYLSGTIVTLYALWYENGTEKYTVTYVSENSEYTYSDTTVQYVIVDNDWSTASMPQLTENNSDKTKTKYFAGWSIDGTTIYNSLSDTLFTNTDDSITLEAVWYDKNKLNITVDTYDNGTKSSSITDSIWYIPGESKTISTSYLPSGYAYKATVDDSSNMDVTLGTAFSTSGFDSEQTLTIELHNIITVIFQLETASDFKDPSITVSQYVDSSGKIVYESKTSSTATTISVIYGTNVTAKATASSYSAFYIRDGNGTELKSASLWSTATYSGTITADFTIKICN